MTDPAPHNLQYFIAPGEREHADGTHNAPFSALADVLAHSQTTDSGKQLSSGQTLEITCVERPGASYASRGTATHQFFIDPISPAAGDGSEQKPWQSFTDAKAALTEQIQSQQITLLAGQRLTIAHREVFTATSLERTKALKQTVAKLVFLCMTLTCVLPVVFILSYLVFKAWPGLSGEFLLSNPRQNLTAGGIWSPLVGTFFLVLTSLVVAAPVGILAGVYLNEYARDNWFTRIINLAVVNLAGVPSIVHALFGVGAFVHFANMGRSLLAAACTVAVMTLPVIITSTREALAAVPMAFREACWNMGATRWQTIRTIVLPNSISGILTGVILQVSRAAGETAPILFTGAILYVSIPDSGWDSLAPYGPNDRFMALSYHLFALSTQIRGISDELLYGTAVVLIGLVLLVNSSAIGLRIYLRSRKKW